MHSGVISLTSKLPPEFKNLPPILDTEQVADLLQVHVNTVARLLNSGDIKGFRVGRVWRIHRRDFLEYVGLVDNGG